MASVKIEDDDLHIAFSLLDKLLSLHGAIRIPFAHVTNAYVSNIEELQLQYRLQGTNLGFLKTAGIFVDPTGIIFCDVTGHGDCLVIETLGERFPRIAVELSAGNDPNILAHEICRRIPDAGVVSSTMTRAPPSTILTALTNERPISLCSRMRICSTRANICPTRPRYMPNRTAGTSTP